MLSRAPCLVWKDPWALLHSRAVKATFRSLAHLASSLLSSSWLLEALCKHCCSKWLKPLDVQCSRDPVRTKCMPCGGIHCTKKLAHPTAYRGCSTALPKIRRERNTRLSSDAPKNLRSVYCSPEAVPMTKTTSKQAGTNILICSFNQSSHMCLLHTYDVSGTGDTARNRA